ncbi:MAG: tetratricopeptide repeat protein [Promethearchaeota archaeon]
MTKNKKPDKKIAKRIEKELHESKKLLKKGIKAQKSQDLEVALNHFQNAYEIIQDILNNEDVNKGGKYEDTREGKIVTLLHLGNIHHALNKTDQALEYLKDALVLEEEKGMVGDMRKRVMIMKMIGDIYCDQEKFDDAVNTFEELYYLMVRANAPFDDTAKLLDKLTSICYEHLEKDDPRTVKFFEKSIEVLNIMGRRRGARNMINNLAVVHYRNERYDEALEYYQQALEIDEKRNDMRGKASRLRYIGLVYHKKENWEQALKHYNESLSLSAEIKDSVGKKETLTKLGGLYMAKGDEEKAKEYLQEADQIKLDK